MTPLERAARAIRPDLNWSSSLDDAFKRDAFARARDVLTAIREPSEVMTDEASEPDQGRALWQCMIDAALSEGG